MESDGAGGVLVVGGGCNGNNSIIRCDKNINVIWQKGYSISSNATATSIIRNSKGNFVVGGYAGLSASTKQVLFEIDVTGKVIWSKCFTGFTMVNIENIVELADGGYGLIGYGKIIDPSGGTDIVITRTDKTGKMIWSRILNRGWEAGNDLVQLNDGSLMFCGVTDYRSGNSDALLGKISLSGQVQLLKYFQSEQYNGSPYDVFHTILPVCDNKFAVFGLVDGMVMTFVNKNAQGVCNGTIIPENQLTVKDTLYAEEPYTVSEVALSFHDTVYSFTGVPNYTSEKTYCSYKDPADKCLITTAINTAAENIAAITIYPNPSRSVFSVASTKQAISQFQVYNIAGEVIKNERGLNTTEFTIDLSEFGSGIYFINIAGSDGSLLSRQKIIVLE